MCGIFGSVNLQQFQENVSQMGQSIKHRGPDDSGIYRNGTALLGHQRLSIIDIDGGHQPMQSHCGRYSIVYNGEIFNFQEVRKKLQSFGRNFTSHSDTEVILHAYDQWKEDCLHEFNGMFAFAIWDSIEQKLWLSRDRVGEKPLYYYSLNGGGFIFASESKAISNLAFFKKELNFEAASEYFRYRYVQGDHTLFKGITKLKPAHHMTIDHQGNITEIKRWWSLPDRSSNSLSDHEIEQTFDSLFSSAVSLRTIADVPVGLYLSSGIDSASIAFELAKNQKFETFTIGFGENLDEISKAEKIAKDLDFPHHAYIVQDSDFDYFKDAVLTLDEPYADIIILPTLLLSKMARNRVKVVLSGEGADEIFGGYIHHEFFKKYHKLAPLASLFKLSSYFINLIPVALLDQFFAYPASMGKEGRNRLAKLMGQISSPAFVMDHFCSLFDSNQLSSLVTSNFAEKLIHQCEKNRLDFFQKQNSPLDSVMKWDFNHWFPNQTLHKFDRLSMANSLEGRTPFLDHRLIEFLFSLSQDDFIRISQSKKLLRNKYQRHSTGIGQKKQAFYMPLNQKFKKASDQLISDHIRSKHIMDSGLFNKQYIYKLEEKRRTSPLLVDKQLVSLAIFSIWLENANLS